MTLSTTTLPVPGSLSATHMEASPQPESFDLTTDPTSGERSTNDAGRTPSAVACEDTAAPATSNTFTGVARANGVLDVPLTPPRGTTGVLSQPGSSDLTATVSPRAGAGESVFPGLGVVTDGVRTDGTPSAVQLRALTKYSNLKANKEVWTTMYWPYCAAKPQDTVGNPTLNLWAKDGCLDKLDQLLTKRGLPGGARDHELVPALNFLKNDGSPSGYYVPEGRIREADAERTTGVDFTGNGQLDADVKIDFLDDNSMFGQNGRTDGTLDVAWWGSCDKVALAGLLFDDPQWPVTLDGVTFTAQDIRGLLTIIAGSQAPQFEYAGTRFSGRADRVVLKDGSVHFGRALNVTNEHCLKSDFERVNGNQLLVRQLVLDDEFIQFESASGVIVIAPQDVVLLEREDKAEPSASDFHQTVKRWLGEGRPFAMDRDPGEHIWNISVDEAHIWKKRQTPFLPMPTEVVGFNGPKGDGDLCFYKTLLKSSARRTETYYYWIEKRDGEHINSGWLRSNPAFLWRPTVAEASFEGDNERNPFVDPAIVQEIYRKSMGTTLDYVVSTVSDWVGPGFLRNLIMSYHT